VIAELADRVRLELGRHKFPYTPTYGPERAQRKGYAPGIVFRRDRENGDPIEPPTGWKGQPDPPALFNRRFSGVVEIFVRSNRPNAGVRHHEDECDRVCDGVLCALYRATTGFQLRVTESRLLRAEELEGGECFEWAGCAARIRFSLASPVFEVDYTGDGPATGTVADTDPPIVTPTGGEFPDYDPAP
jgi:hypothetical protein